MAALTLGTVMCAASTQCGRRVSDQEWPRQLEAGETIRIEIRGGDRHAYHLPMQAGYAARIVIDQRESDLIVGISPPDGAAVFDVDARERGVESLTILAEATGVFEIAVRPVRDVTAPAAYEIALKAAPEPITDGDRVRARAGRLGTEGKRLASTGTADAQSRALEALRGALPLWRELGDGPMEAATLAALGDVLHARGEWQDAQTLYLEALSVSQRIGDRRQLGELLNNLGVIDWRRGLLSDATARFEEALEEWRAISFPRGEAATLTNDGNLFFEAADYQRALERFLSALEIFQSIGDVRGEAFALNNIGVTHRVIGDLAAALTYMERALARFRAAGEVVPQSLALVRLGQIHLAGGDAAAAARAIGEALPLIRSAGNPVAEADALHVQGQIAESTGDREQALSHYEQALARYRAAGSSRGAATALHHTGTVLLAMGDRVRAREALEAALAIRHAAGLRDAEAETLYHLALVEWRSGNSARARSHLRTVLALIEEVRGRVAGEYSQTTYFAARQRYFSTYIDLLMQLHARQPSGRYAAEAFEASERARARSLLDLVGESRADLRRGADPALLARQVEQQRELNLWSYRLSRVTEGTTGGEERAAVSGRIAELLTQYHETEARIRASNPAHAALIRPPVLGAADLQRQVLDADTILVRFALGEERSYVWVLSQRSLAAATLPAAAEIDRLARRVYEIVRAARTPSNAQDLFAAYRREAARLSAMLLAPVAAELNARRLLIVCDGALQLVPFAALPVPGSGSPLIERHEIVMLPSGSVLAALRQQIAGRAPAPKRLAVLADPVYESTDPRVMRSAPASAGGSADRRLPPAARLPFSRFEGKAILGLVPPAERFEAFGFAASRETAVSPVLQDYRIVHFAAHAVIDDTHPEMSGIVLSLVDAAGAAQDGLVRVTDILASVALPQSDLVVISGCETAVGRDVPGEGLLALARGFFAAGAPRVVASLYKVQDEAAAEFMKAFYEAMLGSDRLPPAAALRAAQLKMATAARWQDPHWWTAWVAIGDAN